MEHPGYYRRIAMLEMLSFLQDRVEEGGQATLWLDFHQEDSPSLGFSDEHIPGGQRINVGSELGVNGAQAIATLRALGTDGYVSLELDQYGFDAGAGGVGVIITESGLRELGQLPIPNPQIDLEERLDAILEAIQARPDIPDQEKTRAETMQEEAKTFGRGFAPAVAVQMLRALAAQYGIHIP